MNSATLKSHIDFLSVAHSVRFSMPRLLLLSILFEAEKKERESGKSLATIEYMYIGELEARYYECAKAESYSYESIRNMARTLLKAGLLTSRKDAQFVQYRISRDGRKFMRSLEQLSHQAEV